MAKNTSESLMVLMMTAVEAKDLTSELIQYWVGAIWAPLVAKGTVMEPPKTASHRIAKAPCINLFWWKTAWIRRKNRYDAEETAKQ